MSFKPFMGILGTGLVTSDGAHWQQQRVKVGPVLRHDMLENLADVAQAATERFPFQLATSTEQLLSRKCHVPFEACKLFSCKRKTPCITC